MGQLKMLRPSAPILPRPLPQGYTYAPYEACESRSAQWLELCRLGKLLPEHPPEGGVYQDWFRVLVLEHPDLDPRRDLWFVTDREGRAVASICAVKHGEEEGYIHMVTAHPDVRGQGIGHAMLSHALSLLEARGCSYALLTTDDFRLPAIKTYLDAGFRPVLWEDPDSDQRARWDAVLAELRYPPVPFLQGV